MHCILMQILPKNFFCIDHQHGRHVTWLQTKNRVHFPVVLDSQHGRCDITCKPATFLNAIKYCSEIVQFQKISIPPPPPQRVFHLKPPTPLEFPFQGVFINTPHPLELPIFFYLAFPTPWKVNIHKKHKFVICFELFI